MTSSTHSSLRSDKDFFIECSNEYLKELKATVDCLQREIEFLRDDIDEKTTMIFELEMEVNKLGGTENRK